MQGAIGEDQNKIRQSPGFVSDIKVRHQNQTLTSGIILSGVVHRLLLAVWPAYLVPLQVSVRCAKKEQMTGDRPATVSFLSG